MDVLDKNAIYAMCEVLRDRILDVTRIIVKEYLSQQSVEKSTASGTVESISPLKVSFESDSIRTPAQVTALTGYTPAEGHKVAMIRIGSKWFIVGRIQ